MWAGIKYFIGNVFRCLLLLIIVFVLYSKRNSDDDISNSLMWVFFLGGYYSCVVGSFTFGDYKVTLIEEGFSFGAAFLLYAVAYAIVTFILSHVALFIGLAILFFGINRTIETVKFWYDVPIFFNVTSIISIGLVVLSTIFSFSSHVVAGLGMLLFIFVLELINFTSRAFHASEVLDY